MRGQSLPPLAMIWAQDVSGLLGLDGAMAWNVPDDFAFFKAQTMGCPVIMGRATYESFHKPLPGRLCIVLSRSAEVKNPATGEPIKTISDRPADGWPVEDSVVVSTMSQAIDVAHDYCSTHPDAHHVWIGGGGTVYQQVMDADLADKLVVTTVNLDVVPHLNLEHTARLTYAPRIDSSVWAQDESSTDSTWRPISRDASWRVTTWVRR